MYYYFLISYVIVGTALSRANCVYREILCLRVGGISKQVDKLTGKYAIHYVIMVRSLKRLGKLTR